MRTPQGQSTPERRALAMLWKWTRDWKKGNLSRAVGGSIFRREMLLGFLCCLILNGSYSYVGEWSSMYCCTVVLFFFFFFLSFFFFLVLFLNMKIVLSPAWKTATTWPLLLHRTLHLPCSPSPNPRLSVSPRTLQPRRAKEDHRSFFGI